MSTVKGTIKMIGETKQVSEKFKKREFVITTEGQYPQDILLEVTQDKTSLLDSISIGQTVEAHYNLRGREWVNPQGETKYFNTIDAWKIEAGSVTAHDAAHDTAQESIEDGDDLPF